MLAERRPNGNAELLDIQAIGFEIDVRDELMLLIGHTPGRLRYLYIAPADGHIRSDLDRLDWLMVNIELFSPFSNLCPDGLLKQDTDKRRLRASVCYLMLLHRYVETFKGYAGFSQDLIDAVDSIGAQKPSQDRPETCLSLRHAQVAGTET